MERGSIIKNYEIGSHPINISFIWCSLTFKRMYGLETEGILLFRLKTRNHSV